MSGANLDMAGALNKIAGTVNKSGQEAANIIADAVAASNGSSLTTIVMPARLFGVRGGTPTLTVSGEYALYTMAKGDAVSSSWVIPTDWTTFAIDILVKAEGAPAGTNHVFTTVYGERDEGESSSTGSITATDTTTAALGQNVLDVVRLEADITNNGDASFRFRIQRQNVAGDDAGVNMGFIEARLVKQT